MADKSFHETAGSKANSSERHAPSSRHRSRLSRKRLPEKQPRNQPLIQPGRKWHQIRTLNPLLRLKTTEFVADHTGEACLVFERFAQTCHCCSGPSSVASRSGLWGECAMAVLHHSWPSRITSGRVARRRPDTAGTGAGDSDYVLS